MFILPLTDSEISQISYIFNLIAKRKLEYWILILHNFRLNFNLLALLQGTFVGNYFILDA